MRSRIIGIAVLIALVGIIYLYGDYQRSFPTPLEAIITVVGIVGGQDHGPIESR